MFRFERLHNLVRYSTSDGGNTVNSCSCRVDVVIVSVVKFKKAMPHVKENTVVKTKKTHKRMRKNVFEMQ